MTAQRAQRAGAGGRADAADRPAGAALTAQLGKRVFDLLAGSTALLLVSPVMLAAAILVKLTTPGPVLFRQRRLGLGQRPFVLCKFRTMYTGCSDDAHRAYVRKLLTEDEPPAGGGRGLYKLQDDPRITPAGRLLRRLSIDELPQLINVIRGDMSLVGPRPALPWEAELFGPAYSSRFLVPPGLTGLWQVSGRNGLTMREGLEIDLEYVRRQRLSLDILILLKTVPVVLTGNGAL